MERRALGTLVYRQIQFVPVTFIAYFIVGDIAAIVDISGFMLLTSALGIPWFWAAVSSFVAATAVNYVLSIRFVFESGGAWLFTLGPPRGSSPGGRRVAEIGPVPSFTASEYLLRINRAGGPPGAKTPVHMHPGVETFCVLSGELTQKMPDGLHRVSAGQSMRARS